MPETYRYRLIPTGAGSWKYGPCDMCNTGADEVYHQIEEQAYTRPDGTQGWISTRSTFGHKDCLIRIRRGLSRP